MESLEKKFDVENTAKRMLLKAEKKYEFTKCVYKGTVIHGNTH